MIIDPETATVFVYADGDWHKQACADEFTAAIPEESCAS